MKLVKPIADRHVAYAQRVQARLQRRGLRVEVDASNERMNAKIRAAQLQRVPYMLVVGDREAEATTAAVRTRSGEDLGALSLTEIGRRLVSERDRKVQTP